MKNINTNICIGMILGVLILAGFVSAFGVSSSVWRGNPLMVSPGGTKVAKLGLQNMVGDSDVTVKAAITLGNEIASVDETEYLVKAGTKDTEVPVVVSIPANVPVGTNYSVTVSFLTVSKDTGGAVFLGTGIDTTFDVLITAPVEGEEAQLAPEQISNIWWIAGGIIVILIILIIIVLKKKQK